MAGSAYFYAVALCSPLILYALSQIVRFVRWFAQVRRIKAVLDQFVAAEKPHWLYGHTKYITGPNEATMMKYVEWTAKDKRGAFSISLGPSSWLVACHPSFAKQILATAGPKGFLTYTETGYKFLVPWLGDGLLNSTGEKWFRNRRLLTPAFHFDILKPYMKIYNSCTEKSIESFQQLSQENRGQSIDVVPLISLCTLNVMRKCAFSSHDDIQVQGVKEQQPYVEAVAEIGDLVMKRFFNPLLSSDVIFYQTKGGKQFVKLRNFSHEVAKSVIMKRKEEITQCEKPTGRHVDFLDILLLAKDEDGKSLTDAEILDEVETFMFEGHDTTASAISWILYNFARHPQIQQKAQEEIDSVLPEPGQQVEWDDMSRIPYTTRCIKESMRLHPPVPLVLRELSKPMEIAGTTLLPGTIIEIHIYSIHHNPTVWGPDHMTFDPDRFLPDNMAKMDSHAYIPFSAGPRNCIGQNFAMNEIKTSVMQILKRFELLVDEDHKVEMIPSMVLRSADGIKLHFKSR